MMTFPNLSALLGTGGGGNRQWGANPPTRLPFQPGAGGGLWGGQPPTAGPMPVQPGMFGGQQPPVANPIHPQPIFGGGTSQWGGQPPVAPMPGRFPIGGQFNLGPVGSRYLMAMRGFGGRY